MHYIQFVRELSVKCRENNLVLSVDNYVPKPYNTQYDLKEQAAVADYVFIMAYDEHTDGSNEAGSVASISYLENGVTDALEACPERKAGCCNPVFLQDFGKKLQRRKKSWLQKQEQRQQIIRTV